MTRHSICSGSCPPSWSTAQLSPIQLHVGACSTSPLPLTCPGLLGLPWMTPTHRWEEEEEEGW